MVPFCRPRLGASLPTPGSGCIGGRRSSPRLDRTRSLLDENPSDQGWLSFNLPTLASAPQPTSPAQIAPGFYYSWSRLNLDLLKTTNPLPSGRGRTRLATGLPRAGGRVIEIPRFDTTGSYNIALPLWLSGTYLSSVNQCRSIGR